MYIPGAIGAITAISFVTVGFGSFMVICTTVAEKCENGIFKTRLEAYKNMIHKCKKNKGGKNFES